MLFIRGSASARGSDDGRDCDGPDSDGPDGDDGHGDAVECDVDVWSLSSE